MHVNATKRKSIKKKRNKIELTTYNDQAKEVPVTKFTVPRSLVSNFRGAFKTLSYIIFVFYISLCLSYSIAMIFFKIIDLL